MKSSDVKVTMRTVVFFFCGLFTAWQSVSATTFDKQASLLKLSAEMLSTDNSNPTLDSASSASAFELNASGQLVSYFDQLWLQLDYGAVHQQWQLSESDITQSDQYQQAHLGIDSRWHIDNAWFIEAGAKVAHQDELIGTGLSSLRRNIVIADSKNNHELYARWVYGKDARNRNISLSYRHNTIDYDDNNAYANLFDLQQQTLTADITFVSSSTARLMLYLEHQQDNYKALSRNDSKMQRVMLGMDWQPSGNSRFSLLVGQYQRQPTGGEKNDGVTWQMSYEYSPRDDFRTQITSSNSSVAGESELASDSVRQLWRINVDYLFSRQWQYGSQGQFSTTEYQEFAGKRSITERLLQFWAQLNIRDYHRVRLQLGHRQSDESNGLFDFQQNEVSLNWFYDF